MNPLHQLPSGTWVDLADVHGVMLEEFDGVIRVKVLVRDGTQTRYVHAGECATRKEAESARDEIARAVNEARADMGEKERAS